MDCLIIDDSNLGIYRELTVEERLEKFIYLGDDRNIVDRYVAGKLLKEPR